jgi:two-component system nitrate/nitrite sensor histidine kinase NarX
MPIQSPAVIDHHARTPTDATLREREMLFRGVFEAAADGLFIFDPDSGEIFEGNPAISRMHGYTPAEFIRLNRAELVHPGMRETAAHFVTQVTSGEAARVQMLHLRRDGSSFPVATQGSTIVYQGRPAILGVVRDITSEEEAQQELERRVAERTQELALLLDISRDVTSTLELKSLLALILTQLKTVVDYTGAALLTLEDEELLIAEQLGPLSEADARRFRYPISGLAPVWDRLSRGEAINIPDVRGSSAEAQVYRALVGAELDASLAFIRTCLWAPLVVKGELLGILSITRREPNAFEPAQIEMAMAIARQAAVAIVNARVHEQARTVAVHKERQRLARDLHDAVTQTLFSASLIGDVLPTLWSRNPQRGEEALQDLRILTRGALAEMRTLLFELRPKALEEAPLAELLQHLADAFAGRSRVSVTLTVEGITTLPSNIQVAFYRITQEALHNVAKHADATEVDLRLVATADGAVQLTVRDDGRGFDPIQTPAGHFGLQTMRERATAIGADFSVHSTPGEGTEVLVCWQDQDTRAERAEEET